MFKRVLDPIPIKFKVGLVEELSEIGLIRSELEV